jgi:LuxR family maltose regulon positive regulatory protein
MLNWLESLPPTVLDARPALWVRSALSSLFAGQTTGVEEKLQAAEDSLRSVEAVYAALDLGVNRAILGTLAIEQPDLLIDLLDDQRHIELVYRQIL